uniref:Uncharacterized protein n=1 Tax=Rhizophora mucronata TaxID=61149 RepID=A0A2P2QDA9_RHIMU
MDQWPLWTRDAKLKLCLY